MPASKTQTYTDNYNRLKEIATCLRQGDSSIDELLPLVEEGLAAFKVCKERIKMVSEALGKALPQDLEKLAD